MVLLCRRVRSRKGWDPPRRSARQAQWPRHWRSWSASAWSHPALTAICSSVLTRLSTSSPVQSSYLPPRQYFHLWLCLSSLHYHLIPLLLQSRCISDVLYVDSNRYLQPNVSCREQESSNVEKMRCSRTHVSYSLTLSGRRRPADCVAVLQHPPPRRCLRSPRSRLLQAPRPHCVFSSHSLGGAAPAAAVWLLSAEIWQRRTAACSS